MAEVQTHETSSRTLGSDPLSHRASLAPGCEDVHQKLRVEEQGDAFSVSFFFDEVMKTVQN